MVWSLAIFLVIMIHEIGKIQLNTYLLLVVSLVEQELPTLPEHLSSPPVFSGVMLLDL
jgi:hypothetical protein